jgi:hypothetical protein
VAEVDFVKEIKQILDLLLILGYSEAVEDRASTAGGCGLGVERS